MTISSSVTSSGPYTGLGTGDTFAYAFRILDKGDLLVTETDAAGVESTLVEGTDYSVTGVGDAGGGNVFRTAGNLPVNFTLFIERNTPLTQTIDYGSQGTFLPQTYEDGLDKQIMLIQEMSSDLLRAIRSPDTEPAIALTLANIAGRKDALLAFDSAGLPVTTINATAAAAAITAALASGTAVTSDAFSGNGVLTAFTLSVAPAHANGLLVTLDGVVQRPTTDYTVASTTLTFITAPPNGANIVARNFGNAVAVSPILQPPVFKVKTATTTRNTGGPQIADLHLTGWNLAADTWYKAKAYLLMTENGNGFAVAFAFSQTVQFGNIVYVAEHGTGTDRIISSPAVITTAFSSTAYANGVDYHILVEATFKTNAGSGGTLDLNWSSVTAGADTDLFIGTRMEVTPIL